MFLRNLVCISSGVQIVDEKTDPLMSPEESRTLIERLPVSDDYSIKQIQEKLIRGHMALARAIATTYARATHMHPPELYSEALFALTIATMRVDPLAPNCNYRAFVRTYIHGYLQQYISRNKTILSTPGNTVSDLPEIEEYNSEKHDPANQDEALVDKFERLLGQAGLTDFESKVITLYMTGISEEQIGGKLGFSRTHVRNVRIDASAKLRLALEAE